MEGCDHHKFAEKFLDLYKKRYEEAPCEENLAAYCSAISKEARVYRDLSNFGMSAGYYEEEIILRRKLLRYYAKDEEYRFLLALALFNYGVDLSKLWQYSLALDALEEAYELIKEMSGHDGEEYAALLGRIEDRVIFIANVGAEISYLIDDREMTQIDRDMSKVLYMREQRDWEKDEELRVEYTMEIFQEIVKKIEAYRDKDSRGQFLKSLLEMKREESEYLSASPYLNSNDLLMIRKEIDKDNDLLIYTQEDEKE